MSTFIAGRAVRKARENEGPCAWCGSGIRKGARYVVGRDGRNWHAAHYAEAYTDDIKPASEAEIRAAADVRADEEDREDPVRAEAERLTREWNDALAAYRRDDSARAFEAEQTAYDALVDFVEENDLNYSEFDPRGPEEAQQP